MKAPMTDRTLGINVNYESKFSDVRKKARDEYIERCKKRKRDKHIDVPEYNVDDEIVIRHSRTQHYSLLKVVDFRLIYRGSWAYFGVVIKTSHKSGLSNIGRLDCVRALWDFRNEIVNVPPESIEWIEEGI